MSPVSDAFVVAAVTTATLVAAIVDLRTRRVPNTLTGSVALLGIGTAALGLGRISLLASVAGCLVGLALMLPGHLLGATGGGDVKLLAAVGTMLGPGATLRAFLATAIAGGLIAIVVAVRRGRLAATLVGTGALLASAGSELAEIRHTTHDNRFAYAPAIAVGAIMAALI
jgi:prepilin peptidase CpaA